MSPPARTYGANVGFLQSHGVDPTRSPSHRHSLSTQICRRLSTSTWLRFDGITLFVKKNRITLCVIARKVRKSYHYAVSLAASSWSATAGAFAGVMVTLSSARTFSAASSLECAGPTHARNVSTASWEGTQRCALVAHRK